MIILCQNIAKVLSRVLNLRSSKNDSFEDLNPYEGFLKIKSNCGECEHLSMLINFQEKESRVTSGQHH